MKGKKLDRFTYELTRLLTYPEGIRIDHIEDRQLRTMRIITVGNDTMRNKVFEWIEATVETVDDYDTEVYGTDVEQVKKSLKDVYNQMFYRSDKRDYSF